MRIVGANYNDFNWNVYSLCQLQLFQLKHIIWADCNCFAEIHIAWVNYNYFNWDANGLSQLQLFKRKCTYVGWANYNYFNRNTHSLSQLQLSQLKCVYMGQLQLFWLKHAWSVPIATILSQACILCASGNYSTATHIVWANCTYLKWNTNSMSQLQLFQLKHA